MKQEEGEANGAGHKGEARAGGSRGWEGPAAGSAGAGRGWGRQRWWVLG